MKWALITLILFPFLISAKEVKVRKYQEVDFEEMTLNGKLRKPEGAFLVQKSGIRFQSLYTVEKSLDQKLRNSVRYIDER